MKKPIQLIVVGLLLIIFPAVSYLYLNRGLSYRLNKMEQLQPKASLPETTSTSKFSYLSSPVKWTLLGVTPSEDSIIVQDLFTSLSDFYEESTPLQYIFINPQQINTYPLKDSLRKAAGDRFDLIPQIFLIDRSGNILNSYDPRSNAEKAKLLEHLALLIPEEE